MKIKSFIVLTFAAFLTISACSSNPQLNQPLPTNQPSQMSPPEVRPTPTPTQHPLPPTAAYTPTNTPFPTSTPLPTPLTYVEQGSPVPQPESPITAENADQIVELARWGYGAINQVEFSPDGRLMLVQTSIGIYAYKSGTLDQVWDFVNDTGATSLAVSPANDWLFVGTHTGEIYQLDLNNGQVAGILPAHAGKIRAIAYSPDKNLLASSGNDNLLNLWQGSEKNEFTLSHQFEFEEPAKELFFIENGRQLAVRIWLEDWGARYQWVNVDEGILLDRNDEEYYAFSPKSDVYFTGWDFIQFSDNKKISTIQRQPPFLHEEIYAISPQGNYMASGADEGVVYLYRVKDGTLVHVFDPLDYFSRSGGSGGYLSKPVIRSGPGGPDMIRTLAFSNDEKYVVAANLAGNIFLLNLESGEVQKTLHGKGKNLKFLPDGNGFVFFSKNNIEIYQLPSGERTAEIWEGWKDTRVLFSPAGTQLASGARLWVLETGEQQYAPPGEKILTFNENGNYVYTLRRQWWVAQRRTSDLELQRQVALKRPESAENHSYAFGDLAWWELRGWSISPDGTFACAAAYETPFFFWSLGSGDIIDKVRGNFYNNSYFSKEGKYFAAFVGRDLGVWEKLANGKHVWRIIENHSRGLPIDVVFASEDLLYFLADEIIYAYDLSDGDLIDSFSLGDRHISGAVSPDGKLMAVSTGTTIVIWDLEQETILHQFDTHFDWITTLAFSPDGRYLASASRDGTVRIWGIPQNP